MSGHPYVIKLNEMCGCPVMPVNRWTMPDGSYRERTISATSGERDAEEFIESGATEWVLRCPECGKVFLRGA